MFLNKKKD